MGCPGTAREGGNGVRPLLENSTACRKLVPSSNNSRQHPVRGMSIRFLWYIEQINYDQLVWTRINHRFAKDDDSVTTYRFRRVTASSSQHTFTESLILAQDERWRRA